MFFNVNEKLFVFFLIGVLAFVDLNCGDEVESGEDSSENESGSEEPEGSSDDLEILLKKLALKIESLLKGNDPYYVENKLLDFDSDLIKSMGYVQKAHLSDMSNIKIATEFRNESNLMYVGLNVTSKSFLTMGDYKLDLNVLEQFFLQGKGNFGIALGDVDLKTQISVRESDDHMLHIIRFDVAFNIERLQVAIKGLFGGGAVGKLVNEILNSLILRVLAQYRRSINAGLSLAMKTMAQNSLNGLTRKNVTDIIHGIIGE